MGRKSMELSQGERYGKWVVLGSAPSEIKNSRYLCVCDCGIVRAIRTAELKRGRSQSCGCSRRVDGAAFNLLYAQFKSSAKKRGYEWKLSKEAVKEITLSECTYCENPPFYTKETAHETYTYNGIDRVNNDIGYTEENCVACCGICNISKGTRNADEFLVWIQKVYEWMI